jgi:hypothetical protein
VPQEFVLSQITIGADSGQISPQHSCHMVYAWGAIR